MSPTAACNTGSRTETAPSVRSFVNSYYCQDGSLMSALNSIWACFSLNLTYSHLDSALTWSGLPPSQFSAISAHSAPSDSAPSDTHGEAHPASLWCLLPSQKESQRCRSPRVAGGGRHSCHCSPCTPAWDCPSSLAGWPSPPEPCGLQAWDSGCGKGQS